MRWLAILAPLLLSGCAHLEWVCEEPVVIRLEPTRSIVRCPTDGRSVTVTHPPAPKDQPNARDLPPR